MTVAVARKRINQDWWSDPALKESFNPLPIDLDWDWSTVSLELDGRRIRTKKMTAITGDGAVQGATMVSSDPVPSLLDAGQQCLFVELLFVAPRNRPALRIDGRPYLQGVGSELLAWGAWFSRHLGHHGRLRLDGSPDFVDWYEKRGLQRLPIEPTVYEGVTYVPMELPPGAADRLLVTWPG